MKLEVGKYYKTYGGWKAIIIWDKDQGIDELSSRMQTRSMDRIRYYVIHKPKEEDEKYVITHSDEGRAISEFSVGEPPLYNKHHPADLKEEWK